MFTLETKVPMKPSPAESELEKKEQPAPLRFTYASGSRPLDGYQIKRGVGRGGFGEVYFAVSDAGKEVALKLIRRNLDVEVRGVTQCLNLKHQNLVALYDIRNDEHDDRWVVMEYVSGESLEDAIDRHPTGMPTELAMSWFSGIAAGVAYLHDHGIVHRDLKPANIFIDEDIVKIGDYGLSKFISCSRRSGQTESVGTVHYMAPEIANGRYGKEIDTYALGIILYEMLTGHVPFEGESVGEVLMKHLTAEPDLTVLDQPYRELVRSAMTKDPNTRIQSVAEMVDRLPEVGSALRLSPPVKARADEFASVERDPAATQNIPTSTPPISTRPTHANEEPILAAVRSEWNEFKHGFHNNFNPLGRALIIISVVGLLVFSARAWIPALFVMGFVYLVYRAVRAVVYQPSSGVDTSPATQPPNERAGQGRVPAAQSLAPPVLQSKRQYARRRRQSWQRQLRQHVAAKPARDRIAELVGSMIVAAVIASLLAVLGVSFVSTTYNLELFVWMAIVATVGSWAVMVPNKLAEGRVEDQAPLRFSLLIAGAMVGMVACGAAHMLDLQLPVSREVGIHPGDSLAIELLDMNPDPTLLAGFSNGLAPLQLSTATAYFAFLFVIVRWWRQAEFARTHRVSFWSIAACSGAAFLLTFVWWFPQPLGAVLAGMVAFTTQLASPWMPPSQRRELAEQGVV